MVFLSFDEGKKGNHEIEDRNSSGGRLHNPFGRIPTAPLDCHRFALCHLWGSVSEPHQSEQSCRQRISIGSRSFGLN
jgi:hypothetical protein